MLTKRCSIGWKNRKNQRKFLARKGKLRKANSQESGTFTSTRVKYPGKRLFIEQKRTGKIYWNWRLEAIINPILKGYNPQIWDKIPTFGWNEQVSLKFVTKIGI